MVELEEERMVQEAHNREVEAISKKEKIIERSKSRGKNPTPAAAPTKVVTKS
jgi:hypothetical protein